MNLHCNTAKLRAALRLVNSLPGASNADIVSQNVQIDAGFDITLRRMSPSAFVEVTLNDEGAIVEAPACIAVPHTLLDRAVANASDDIVVLKADPKRLTVTSGRTRITIPLWTEQLHEPPPDVEGDILSFTAEFLRTTLADCLSVASTDSTRENIRGVVICSDANGFAFFGGDGKIAHFVTVAQDCAAQVLIPSEVAQAMVRLLAECDDDSEAVLTLGKDAVRLDARGMTLSGALSSVKPPNVLLFRDASCHGNTIELDRESALEALKGCHGFGGRLDMIDVTADDTRVNVSSYDDERPDAKAASEVTGKSEHPLAIRIGATQLQFAIRRHAKENESAYAEIENDRMMKFTTGNLCTVISLIRITPPAK